LKTAACVACTGKGKGVATCDVKDVALTCTDGYNFNSTTKKCDACTVKNAKACATKLGEADSCLPGF